MRLFLCAAMLLLLASCKVNNIKIDNDLKSYFDKYKVTGTFALYDNADGSFTIYDSAAYKKRYCPASTFKIVNSLIGLETGKISDEKMIIKWDGQERWVKEWNQDLTMEQAFKFSAVPYYQEVAKRIGRDTMQFWIDSLKYGNMNISGPIDSFWLNNTLQISPDEELGLVKRLYFDKLPFQKRTQEIVRKVMLREDNSLYKLSYKTGLTGMLDDVSTAWIVGWIEENRHPYFFVLLVQSKDKENDLINNRISLLKDILSHYDFMKGKK